MRSKILLADDHPIVLTGLQQLLEPYYEIVAAVENGATLVAEAELKRPDLILVDIGMRVLNGFEAVEKLQAKLPYVKIIFLSFHEDATYVAKAFKLGADGYLTKDAQDTEILQAVATVLAGQTYLSPLVAEQVMESAFPPGATPHASEQVQLTSRQRDVLKLLGEGHSHREIATVLGLTTKSVEYHKSNLMKQLGLRTDAALARYAIQQGFVPLNPKH